MRAKQIKGTKQVEVYYDLIAPEGGVFDVSVRFAAPNVSPNVRTLSGAVGNGIVPGKNKRIVWNAGKDWPNKVNNDFVCTVTAEMSSLRSAIPDGYVAVGDAQSLLSALVTTTRIMLTRDIDMSGVTWPSDIAYNGVLDGCYHTIRNLHVNGGTKAGVGLIACSDGGTFRNLLIRDSSVTGGRRVGALIGWADRCVILNCRVMDTGVVGGTNVGGMIGYAVNTDIQRCSVIASTNEIRATSSTAGGLVGDTEKSRIRSSKSDIRVKSGYYTGGLVGYNSNTPISDSCALGVVTGNGVGGLVGQIESSAVTNVFFVGTVNCDATSDRSVGAVIGIWCGKNELMCSYVGVTPGVVMLPIIGQFLNSSGSDDVRAVTTTEMKKRWTFPTWSNANWIFKDGEYPCPVGCNVTTMSGF